MDVKAPLIQLKLNDNMKEVLPDEWFTTSSNNQTIAILFTTLATAFLRLFLGLLIQTLEF